MGPSSVAASLRRMASRIEASDRPSLSLVVADLRRLVAAVTVFETGEGRGGPWSPASLPEVVAEVERRREAQEFAEEENGVLLFVRKDGRLLQVSDQSAVHGEDAVERYEVMETEEDGTEALEMEAGDDVGAILSAI